MGMHTVSELLEDQFLGLDVGSEVALVQAGHGSLEGDADLCSLHRACTGLFPHHLRHTSIATLLLSAWANGLKLHSVTS